MLEDVDGVLVVVPVVLRHAPDTTDRLSSGAYFASSPLAPYGGSLE
jgi:hypothetical protein